MSEDDPLSLVLYSYGNNLPMTNSWKSTKKYKKLQNIFTKLITRVNDLKSQKVLFEYEAIDTEDGDGLSFQEIKRNKLFFSLGPDPIKQTEEIYAVRGLIDFENRKVYKRTHTKEEYEKRKKENIWFFREIDLSEWTLIKTF